MANNECALGRLDLAALAWAAGFFDGEGTTFTSVRADRPGYLRLEMTVPQCGHDGLPEVLVRFQAAVLGMGTITGPDDDDMYFWKPCGFAEAQATVALLWAQLGEVKRAQAARALHAVRRQYDSGELESRPPRKRRQPHTVHTETCRPCVSVEQIDLAWAAGFLDGEGYFGLIRSKRSRKNGPPWHRMRASATQRSDRPAPPQVLLRLMRALGTGRIEDHGGPDTFKWVAQDSERVSRVLQLVTPWLGRVKFEQATRALHEFGLQVRLRGNTTHCRRGHEYTRRVRKKNGRIRKLCNSCQRLVERQKRAAQGIPPRQFKNVARRYTF